MAAKTDTSKLGELQSFLTKLKCLSSAGYEATLSITTKNRRFQICLTADVENEI